MGNDEPDINKILGNAIILGLEKVGNKTLNTIKKVWLKSTSRYGFTPLPEEATRMNEIAKNQTYLTFKRIVGKYKFTPYIKVGILLYELNHKGNKERADSIRKDVYNSKDGNQAKKIIHIASTGVLLHVLEYLINIKDKYNLSQYAVKQEVDKILNLWKKVSIPVSNADTKEKIISNIENVMKLKENLIVIYACGKAADKAQLVVAELYKKQIFSGKYVPWSKNDIFYGMLHYVCLCYSVEDFGESPLAS